MPNDQRPVPNNQESAPDNQTGSKFYPSKPDSEEGFKKAVAWFGGREMIASLKGMLMYALYGENMDPRSWMKGNIYPNVEEEVKIQKEGEIEQKAEKEAEKNADQPEKSHETLAQEIAETMKVDKGVQKEIVDEVREEWAEKILDYWNWKRDNFGFWDKYFEVDGNEQRFLPEDKRIKEFWFDFIADSGDGQMGVYNVACMCFADLWVEKGEIDHKEKTYPAVRFFPKQDKTPKENAAVASFEDAELEKYDLLPRGYFLFVGGDTAYHSANYATLFERFQSPFRWGFASVRKFMLRKYEPKLPEDAFFLLDGKRPRIFEKHPHEPVKDWDGTIAEERELKNAKTDDKPAIFTDGEPLRPFFGIPANHDYYDSIDGFNRQFRRLPFDGFEENRHNPDGKMRVFLHLPTFSREQEASYIAIRLPFNWWMFGIDSELEKLDYRQEVFFRQIMEKRPSKLILATPEPTTVFGKKCADPEKTSTYLASLTAPLGIRPQPFHNDGKFSLEDGQAYCRLDLSGDVHHYARYWGADTRGLNDARFSSKNYASLVAGGGGAFFDTTSTLIGEPNKGGKPLLDANGDEARGEIPPQAVYPSAQESIRHTADRIFDLWNIKKGGYIQYGGALSAILLFLLLSRFSSLSASFAQFNRQIEKTGWNNLFLLPDSLKDFIYNNHYRHLLAILILLIVTGCLGLCAYWLKNLVSRLKEKNFEDKIDEKTDGRITQLLANTVPLFLGVGFYLVFLRMLIPTGVYKYVIAVGLLVCAATVGAGVFVYWRIRLARPPKNEAASPDQTSQNGQPKNDSAAWTLKSLALAVSAAILLLLLIPILKPDFSLELTVTNEGSFPESFLFLLHLVIAGLLIWLSFDYTNWLAIRFKVSRKFSEKTLTQMIEDPNEKTDDKVLQYIGRMSREFSFKYFPATMLVILAIVVLILGTAAFGRAGLALILADSIFTIVLLGTFILLSWVLGYSTGGAYHKKGKWKFFALGFWHAVLQFLTPLVLYFYANVFVVLFIFTLVIIVNGFSKTSYRIKKRYSEAPPESWKGWLHRRVNYRWGAEVMKLNKRGRLLNFWLGYGLLVLALPFAVNFIFPRANSFNETVCIASEMAAASLTAREADETGCSGAPSSRNAFTASSPGFSGYSENIASPILIDGAIGQPSTGKPFGFLAYWTYIVLSIIIIGFIGYRMSRVWFSWYLAVSVLFDGHNNEAGGLARIEGFKHILRVKVEDDKLTVFVIGLNTARPDLDETLQLNLVDKFELECLPARENRSAA